MHELSIAFEIYNIIDENIKEYNLKNVNLILIRAGSFNGIDEKSLKFAFRALSKGTKCENAKIMMEVVEGFELLVERIEGEENEEYINTKKDTTV